MHRTIPKILLRNSRQLREKQTPWELRLWHHIRAHRFLGLQFKRQVQIGPYIVDFCCREKKLIVELDGGQHNESSSEHYDRAKDEFLRGEGYRILRIWNNAIDESFEGVLEKIREVTEGNSKPLSQPLPSKGERR